MIRLFPDSDLDSDRATKEAHPTIDGQVLDLFVIRDGGAIRAYANSCPHRWVALNWEPDRFLCLDRQYIQCTQHGARFLIGDGLCISGPCQGMRLESLPISIKEGWIVLEMPSKTDGK